MSAIIFHVEMVYSAFDQAFMETPPVIDKHIGFPHVDIKRRYVCFRHLLLVNHR